MAKQIFTVGQILTSAQMTSLQATAMGGGAATAKTASYVLVAADAGTTVAMNAAGATTITVNTALFAAGDTVFIQNLGTGACTVTAGTATVATAGSLILPQNDAGILYFTATGAAIFYDYIQAGAVSPLTTKGDVYTFSTSDARLGVGANNTILTADSAEATGLKWATPSSGGGMTVIGETAASALSSLTYSGFGSYKQLLLMWSGIKHSGSGSVFGVRFNNNSSADTYAGSGILNFSGDDRFRANSLISGTGSGDVAPFGTNAAAAGKETQCYGYVLIDNVTSSTKSKSFTFGYGYFNSSTATTKGFTGQGAFYSTTAITTIDIVRLSGSDTFSNQNDTTIRLLGIA